MEPGKEEIRARVRRRRAQYDLADLQRAGSRIASVCEILLRLMKPTTILCYVSTKGEAPTHDIIRGALARGQRLCVPRFDPKSRLICASALENFTRDLEPGYRGILEPREPALRPLAPETIELGFIPGVAFDPHGRRLGRGEGAFDRFLHMCDKGMIKVGLAFSWQIMDAIPSEPHDVSMDMIVTDEEVIPIKPGLLGEFEGK